MKTFLLDSLDLLFDPKAKSLIIDAFAYGSAVFAQKGNVPSMFDLMINVKDANLFHRYQLESFPSHYSPWMTHRLASFLNNSPPGLYYNTGIKVNGENFKYGIIQGDMLSADLTEWKYLYAAGRLQKPVIELFESQKTRLENLTNRLMALKLAALVNKISSAVPDLREWEILLKTIIELSYKGDIRMFIAENPLKVQKILASQFDPLLEIYKPLYPQIEMTAFPKSFCNYLPENLPKVCQNKVFVASTIQSLKGLATAKPMTAIRYITRKIKKKFIQ
jgi:mitochondrial translocator assembly and maintenance protein 41